MRNEKLLIESVFLYKVNFIETSVYHCTNKAYVMHELSFFHPKSQLLVFILKVH